MSLRDPEDTVAPTWVRTIKDTKLAPVESPVLHRRLGNDYLDPGGKNMDSPGPTRVELRPPDLRFRVVDDRVSWAVPSTTVRDPRVLRPTPQGPRLLFRQGPRPLHTPVSVSHTQFSSCTHTRRRLGALGAGAGILTSEQSVGQCRSPKPPLPLPPSTSFPSPRPLQNPNSEKTADDGHNLFGFTLE